MSASTGDELRTELPTADATRAFGAWLATVLRPGDVVVLTGGLGAGKTTLTQGIGTGLGVRGAVTSPTYVISRVHPSVVGGPALVHVDAYRLGGAAELDDLDLDESVEQAVTVVEWGEGLAEGLADSWLEVRLERWADGGAAALAAGPRRHGPRRHGPRRHEPQTSARTHPPESRVASVRPHGPRWVGAPLRSLLA